VSNFSFLSKKTSAVESSSHAPSRASGRLSRGAAHFLSPAASVAQNRKWQIVRTRPGSRYVGGPVGLAKIYCLNGRRPKSASSLATGPGFDIADCFKQSTQNVAVGGKRSPPHRKRWITRRRRGQSQQSPPVPKAMLNIQRSDIRKGTGAEKEGFHRTSRTGRRARARGQRAIGLSNNPNE